MSSDAIHVTRREHVQHAIALMIQGGEGFRAPLMRAAADGLLSVAIATGGTPIPARFLKLARPTIALLCDDHPDATGPDRWSQARTLFRWADAVILHATGGQDQHYALAAGVTLLSRRVVMVEMEDRHHAAWLALAERHMPARKVINIVPPPGGAHPRQGAQAGETRH